MFGGLYLIQSIKVINFQSLHDVELELGKFTVIVGPSSSGKSALIRAMRAATSNALHSDYITRGAKKSAVSMKTEDATITIEREQGGSSVYKIAKSGSEESRYSKLNRQVPAEVTSALGIVPSTQEVASINFAGQFDSPYLLTESASTVARVLGELTNVSTIFAAVKEASKRVKNASTLLNLRKKDRDSVVLDLAGYQDLGSKVKVIDSIDTSLSECIQLEQSINALSQLLSNIERAENAIVQNVDINIPDIEPMVAAYNRFNEFTQLLRTIAQQQQSIAKLNSGVEVIAKDIGTLDNELHQALEDAGTCPFCEQTITR